MVTMWIVIFEMMMMVVIDSLDKEYISNDQDPNRAGLVSMFVSSLMSMVMGVSGVVRRLFRVAR